MKRLSLFLAFIIGSPLLFAQVGIATISPTAQLELDNDILTPDYPLLELNPQAAPAGTATGQLAVIGDQLYMYDEPRAKWLSVETSVLQFTHTGLVSIQILRYGDVNVENSGAYMPYNGTIIYIGATTADLLGSGANKSFEVRIKNGTALPIPIPFSLSSYKFLKTDYNVDFNAGDYINVRAVTAGGTVTSPSVTVWIKWRR